MFNKQLRYQSLWQFLGLWQQERMQKDKICMRGLLVLEIGSLDLQRSALISWGILIIFRSLRRKKRVKESEVLKTSSHKLTACWGSVSVILRAFNWFCQYCLGNASICTGSCSLRKLAFLCWEWWVARVGGWPLVSRAVLSTTCVGKKKKALFVFPAMSAVGYGGEQWY